jgi:hypothetical protein
VNTQNVPNLAAEIDFTALNARAKQRTLPDCENGAGHANTVGVQQTTDTDTIANLQLRHSKIIRRKPIREKRFFERA